MITNQNDLHSKELFSLNTKNDKNLTNEPKPSWQIFCERTSMHGFKYFVDKDLNEIERKIWKITIFVIFALFCYSILFFNFNYKGSELKTIVENYTYSVHNIPFPAITICPSHRIDSTKIDQAADIFLPKNSTGATRRLFRNFIAKFESFSFGRFEAFAEFENISLNGLNTLNLADILQYITVDCEDIFEKCYLFNIERHCCQFFRKQKTRHGFCYSFNSVLNNEGEKTEYGYPLRVSWSGKKNGWKFSVKMNKRKTNGNSPTESGAYISIHHPQEWVSKQTFISTGQQYSLGISPELFVAVSEVKKISPIERQILFDDEVNDTFYQTLPNTKYSWNNCFNQCRQRKLLHYCNCTLEMLFPTGNYPICNASNFQCLVKIDNFLLNKSMNLLKGVVKTSEMTGQLPTVALLHRLGLDDTISFESIFPCFCLRNSKHIRYGFGSENLIPITNITETERIDFNVFFRSSKMLKYETFLEHSWFDYLTYYGGLASFFLGISVTTVIEIFYYLIIKHFFNSKNKPKFTLEEFSNSENQHEVAKYKECNEHNDIFTINNSYDTLKTGFANEAYNLK